MPEEQQCCSCSCHAALARSRAELAECREELKLSMAEVSYWRRNSAGAVGERDQDDEGRSAAGPLLTDFLPADTGGTAGPWMERRLEELANIANGVTVKGVEMILNVWQFAPMQPGETLQEHVRRQVQQGNCPSPASETSLVFKSNIGLAVMRLRSQQDAARMLARIWGTVATFRSEWQALLKNLLAGNYDPIITRAVLFGEAAKSTDSRGMKFVTWPAVIVDAAGQRHWGMVQHPAAASQEFLNTWLLRDMLTIKHTPSSITVVAMDGGAIMWQNAASMATFGVHGLFNTSAMHGERLPSPADHDPAGPAVARSQYDFVDMIFGSNKAELEQMKAAVSVGDTYRTQIQVLHPGLRALMGLRVGEEVHHDVQMSLTRDPVTLQQVYTVAQIDVTAAVLAKREVQLAHAQLGEEKLRTEALLQRQYELVECLGWVSEVGRSAAGDAQAAELIDNVRRQIVGGGSTDGGGEHIELLDLLGSGSFGKVYKGLWRNKEVAVKSMVLPTKMNGSEKKQKMAIMEAAISSLLSHPNIVQTYTYSLKPVRQGARSTSASLPSRPCAALPTSGTASSGASKIHMSRLVNGSAPPGPAEASGSGNSSSAVAAAASVTAFEVQIVLELCDCGTLREALMQGVFYLPHLGRVNYLAVLEVAADIARGMQHLHACNILHSDLKAANVLLQSNASEARGATAKISDFGLSVQMSSAETHVSGLYQGTMTHMAPEALLCGLHSTATDVYAFGITLWELYTGDRPYLEVPRAHLGYQVTKENKRPLFPANTPAGYEALVKRCWDPTPASRPSFATALGVLQALRMAEPGATPCLKLGDMHHPDGEPLPVLRVFHELELSSAIGSRPAPSPGYSGLLTHRVDSSERSVHAPAANRYRDLILGLPRPSTDEKAFAAPPSTAPAPASHLLHQPRVVHVGGQLADPTRRAEDLVGQPGLAPEEPHALVMPLLMGAEAADVPATTPAASLPPADAPGVAAIDSSLLGNSCMVMMSASY